MSAIGVIYSFEGDLVGETVLSELDHGVASLGPDDGAHLRSGPVGMVYRALHTTKESRREIQPLRSTAGHILCWDGRLDNREEMASILRDDLQEDLTDARIVMDAYL